MKRGMRVVGVFLAALVAMQMWTSLASAATTITPDHGPAGDTYAFSATGFKPGSSVSVVSPFGVGSVTADGSGAVSVNVVTPRNSGVPGVYRLRAQGVDPNGDPIAPFAVLTVTHCANTPTTCPTPTSLPRTGSSELPRQLLVGVGLLCIGAYFVTRKRIRGGHFVPFGAAKGFDRRTLIAIGISGSALALIASGFQAHEAQAAGPGSITGHITDGAGNVGNVCVRAYNATDYGAATTDASGNYTIGNLSDGNYNVAAVDCAVIPTHLPVTPSSASVSGTAATRDFTLVNGGVFVAKSVRDADSTPIKFSCLLLGVDVDPVCAPGLHGGGTLVSEPVAAATYKVGIDPGEGDFPVLFNGGVEDPLTNRITLGAGQVNSSVSLRFKPAGKIKGIVRDAATNQAPSRRVCVVPLINGRFIRSSAFAETDGSFTLERVGETPRKVAFSDCAEDGTSGNAYKNQWYNAKPSLETADQFTVTPGAQKTDVNAAMSSAEGPVPTVPPTTAPPTSAPPTTATTAAPTGSSTTSTTPPATATSSTAPPTSATTIPSSPPAADGAANASANTVAQGGTVTASGGGFGPGTPVNVVLYSTPIKIATVKADANGSVSVTFIVPSGLAVGTHTLQLQGVTSTGATRVLERPLVIVSQLPRTGGLPLHLDAVIATLAIAGLVFRRRVSLRAS